MNVNFRKILYFLLLFNMLGNVTLCNILRVFMINFFKKRSDILQDFEKILLQLFNKLVSKKLGVFKKFLSSLE